MLTPTSTAGAPPRQTLSTQPSAASFARNQQYPPVTPTTSYAGLVRSGNSTNLRDAFHTPQKDTNKDNESVEGSGSRYGDPTDHAKRKVKPDITGTPSGAERRPGKQTRVAESPSETLVPRWQSHTASSLHRRDSNASVRSTASSRSQSPRKIFKNLFSKEKDADKEDDQSGRRG